MGIVWIRFVWTTLRMRRVHTQIRPHTLYIYPLALQANWGMIVFSGLNGGKFYSHTRFFWFVAPVTPVYWLTTHNKLTCNEFEFVTIVVQNPPTHSLIYYTSIRAPLHHTNINNNMTPFNWRLRSVGRSRSTGETRQRPTGLSQVHASTRTRRTSYNVMACYARNTTHITREKTETNGNAIHIISHNAVTSDGHRAARARACSRTTKVKMGARRTRVHTGGGGGAGDADKAWCFGRAPIWRRLMRPSRSTHAPLCAECEWVCVVRLVFILYDMFWHKQTRNMIKKARVHVLISCRAFLLAVAEAAAACSSM